MIRRKKKRNNRGKDMSDCFATNTINETKYSRKDKLKFVEGSLDDS